MFTHRKLAFGAAMIATLAFTGSAFAAHFSFFGNASVVTGGNPGNAAQLVSDSTAPGYGGVELYDYPSSLDDLTSVSFDFRADTSGASGGSPRLVFTLSDGGDVALRPLTFSTSWATVDGMAGNNWDSNGGSCGYVYGGTLAAVAACHAGATITAAYVVSDSGWMYANDLTVFVDNIDVNGHLVTFDPNLPANKDACKKGGWQSLERSDSSAFKNQGDCIQYANTGK